MVLTITDSGGLGMGEGLASTEFELRALRDDRDRLLLAVTLAVSELKRTNAAASAERDAHMRLIARALAHQQTTARALSQLTEGLAEADRRAAEQSTARELRTAELIDLRSRSEQVRAIIANQAAALSGYHDDAEGTAAQLDALSACIPAGELELAGLLHAIRAACSRGQALEAALTDLGGEREAARTEAARLAALSTEQSNALTQHMLNQAKFAEEQDALRQHRDELATALIAICASESWRLGHSLTAPARWLKRLVGHKPARVSG